jgi:hypothetical protein
MNRLRIMVAAAIGLGVFMALVDTLSPPSVSLLAADSTMVLALTTISVALLASPSARLSTKKGNQAPRPTRRTPLGEMAEQLLGASKGYTLNRKEIAFALRTAVNVKIGNEASPLPNEPSDAFLRHTLGDQTFAEFFSEGGWTATRVKDSIGYLARLKVVVATLTKSLEL